jgi:ParB family chromosome partitioning protein
MTPTAIPSLDRTRSKLGRGLKSLLGDPDGGAAGVGAGGDSAVFVPVPEAAVDSDGGTFAVAPAGSAGAAVNGPPAVPMAPAAPVVIPSSSAAGERVIELAPDAIRANPYQPRADFDETGIAELADSLKSCGVLQPLLVRKAIDGGFELIAGERRLRAAKRAGLAKIPVLVRAVSDAETLEQALVENLQRRDLNPMEKAKALSEYLAMHKLTQADGEKRLGMSRSELANHLRLLKLSGAVQEAVRAGKLSYGHARALVAVEDPGRQLELCNKTVAEGLSVRALEDLVKSVQSGAASADPAKDGKDAKPAAPAPRVAPAQLKELEDEFARHVGLKVNIKPGRKANTGVVTIAYGSLDDFDRLRSALAAAGKSAG